MSKILVTGYKSPDLDGAGGAYGLAELLRAQGREAQAVVFGCLRQEAKYIFEKIGAEIESGEKLYNKKTKMILVDACELKGLPDLIDPQNVIEAFDHRTVHNAHQEFPNAVLHIERVGACATLIVEKFWEAKVKPSHEAATLLYLAIVSNTINFKNKVTTERDREAAKYLKNLYQIDDKLIHEMFAKQSEFHTTITEKFHRDKWSNEIAGKVFSVYQFEMIGVDEFVRNNQDEIKKALREVQEKGKFDFAFLTCVDLEKARNTFVVPDKKTADLIGRIIGIKFENCIARYPEIIMRKEIMPKIKEFFERG